MPKFCNNCGAPLRDGAMFCPNCGNQMNQQAQPAQPAGGNNNYPNNNYRNNSQYGYAQQPGYAPQQPGYVPRQPGYPPPSGYGYGYPQPPKKKGGCGTVVLIVFLILLAGLGVGGYFLYKAGKGKVEELKTKFEETLGKPLSSFIEINPEALEELQKQGVSPEDLKKLEKLGVDPEVIKELEKQAKESGTAEESSQPEKSYGNGKLKVKDAEFFGVTLPIPNVGTLLKNETEANSFGDNVTEIRIEGMSYDQYIEYCKMLEALPGWEVKHDYDVAHFPSNANEVAQVQIKGQYKTIPHIAAIFYSRLGKKEPDFQLFVFETF